MLVAGPTRKDARRKNDKPAIVWDVSRSSPHHGRVYLAWTVLDGVGVVVSHSDDDGSHWSRPVAVVRASDVRVGFYASLAVGQDGDLYVAWTDPSREIVVARSTDGGASFGQPVLVDTVVGLPGDSLPHGGQAVPAQPRRGVTVAGTVVANVSRVFVVYGAPGSDRREQDVRAVAFDPRLVRVHRPVQVNPPDGKVASDQFEPVAALNPRTGSLWVCFYDTRGDPSRRSVRYSCTASRDGIQGWKLPRPVATVRSDVTRGDADAFGYGDYQGLAIGTNSVAHPVWTDNRPGTMRSAIYTTSLTERDLSR